MRIEKKTVAPYFQYVLDGVKTYDFRLADFECQPGDILVLKEYDPDKKEYTGREIEKVVTYVSKTKGMEDWWSKEDIDKYGFQIIGFK